MPNPDGPHRESQMHEIGAFLHGYPPFESASREELDQIVAAVEIEFFETGEYLLRVGEADSSYGRVIRTGRVDLIHGDSVIDELNAGDIVGLQSIATALPAQLDARVSEDVLAYRIPSTLLRPLLAQSESLTYVARQLRRRSGLELAAAHAAVGAHSVASLVRSVRLVPAELPVAEVARELNESDTSCVLVTLDADNAAALGIFTDQDFRRAFLRDDSSVTSVGELCTRPLITANASSTAQHATMVMLAHGIKHLPVTNDQGLMIGVVEQVDLLASQSRTPVRLRRLLSRARNPAELVDLASEIRSTIDRDVEADVHVRHSSRTLSALYIAAMSRALELGLDSMGPSPVPFAWLVTGSVARGEALLGSDIDSLLVWDGGDEDPEDKSWMRELARQVLAMVGACGIPVDLNGVRADDPRFSRSSGVWRGAVRKWSDDPAADQGLIYLSALLDATPIFGSSVWEPVGEAVRQVRNELGVRQAFYQAAIAFESPTGIVRDLIVMASGDRSSGLDLKLTGSSAIAAVARYLSLYLDINEPSTEGRLRAASSAGLISRDTERSLIEASAFVDGLRLTRPNGATSHAPADGNVVAPKDLSSFQRRGVRDVFRVVKAAQDALPRPHVGAS